MQPAHQKKQSIIFAVMLLAVVFYAGVLLGRHDRPSVASVTSLTNKEAPPEVLLSTDFTPFWTAWNILNSTYVAATSTTVANDTEKLWGAISGLTASLKDPYTVFFPPEESAMFENEINGNFQGVGMEVGIKEEVLTVIAPLKGTPAERAGIRPGDKILKIDDEVSTNLRVDQAVKLIRGKKGTAVRLMIFREGKSEPFEVTVIRDIIDLPTIDTELKPGKTATSSSNTIAGTGLQKDGVFIIRLYSFSANSANLFKGALRKFISSGSHKLLFDLRGNPGGYLDAAVEMASYFLPTGKVIVTENSGTASKGKVDRSLGYNLFNKNLRMVILVNGGSASASEILAGALQQHGVAQLVGTQTFGKGSVQQLIKVTPETSLKVTVARWFTPNGTSISLKGITPDVVVKMTPEDIEKKRDPQLEKAIELLNK